MSPPRPVGVVGQRSGLSPDAGNSRNREGRTPPPAPSAAFAKRAREIRDEVGVNNVSPFTTSETEELEQEDQIKDTTVDSVVVGFRRARAGTLPSSLPAQRHITEEPPMTATPQLTRTSALSPAYPNSAPSRPALRHAASSAANLETPTHVNRIRSGSLTLLSKPLGNGYGASLFAPTISNPSRSPLGKSAQTEESDFGFTSPSGSAATLGTEDLQFSTLDYLGLAEGGDALLPPASMTELRNQTLRAIANNGPVSRLRASTVSNFNRQAFRQSSSATSYPQNHQEYPNDEGMVGAMEQMGLYDSGYYPENGYLAGTFNSSSGLFRDMNHRPRATTIGVLDNPNRRIGNSSRVAGALASIPQSPVQANLGYSTFQAPYAYAHSPSDRNISRSRDSSMTRAQRPSISSHTSRTGTPDVDKGFSTPQMPTRSLWIGNLDVSATNQSLLQVFMVYGAIESVRMLPEKTCAFVNFMDKADAVRARDDVLNRLGGHVPALSETAPVRIGFGKIDSAPTGMPSSSVAPPPPGLVFPNSLTSVTVPPPVPGAEESSPEQGDEQSSLPTRALWIGSIPATTSSSTLLQIFTPFGPVESARVLMHKCCGFVNFEHLDSAVAARSALNGRDILGSDIGPVRIGFARVPTRSPVIGGPEGEETTPKLGSLSGLESVNGADSVPTEQQLSSENGGVENYRSPLVIDLVKNGIHEQVLEKGLATNGVVSEQQMIMQVLSGDGAEEDSHVRAAAEPRGPATYYTMIPGVHERLSRRFEAAHLKELRRRLDAGGMTQEEIDNVSREMMADAAELASDYIGNTIIQKLFERTDPSLRLGLLERIAPHLATIGVHKNGTWAAQKIIECASTPEEKMIISQNLTPFAPPLMCDSLGNYVCAGTLRFGAPYNEYVFDAMMDRMWDISQNRFGARCMRTCLESPHTSVYQRKRISTGIILNSIPLATNPNGALLLTWLVDQSNLSGRYGLLANRFSPHIAHLCTHKLASLTVLRIITQTAEPAASAILISSIFTSPNDQTLTEILSDANNGSQVIGKILATSTILPDEKSKILESVRRVLPDIKASNTPPYRMLLEAVGLPLPAGGMNGFVPPGRWHQPTQPPFGYQNYCYAQPQYLSPVGGMNLNPLLVPQNMPIGQSMRTGTTSPHSRDSPRTPQPQMRRDPNQMTSPGSDPFNPFASPSIDVPFMPIGGMRGMTFEQQPNMGGLGMMGGNAGQYYQQDMRQSMYAHGFQA
ncbi:hypothetical protein TREMEDRAFT_73973 [Tremella mesenterica DSM 1558]|uniref:uncharacterized protein n=1 Tax=Tremella mesenterica (strain ATCC 24925 / CBS 8224 / DSM 1558 / NBRC 9311 / NRRL Y-6157 / RJB 2259-6 / UBC 559-6) TaxID=578456 RepID=UPI0003F49428|nr:uncharacterized protein TREMEDRAFT_73973 [Tremella mesenterica DSM 1558]EIW68956.1 hypothetical protein TREMEDRAFT_73973 [Tremella mesenterica DSM 1558]